MRPTENFGRRDRSRLCDSVFLGFTRVVKPSTRSWRRHFTGPLTRREKKGVRFVSRVWKGLRDKPSFIRCLPDGIVKNYASNLLKWEIEREAERRKYSGQGEREG